MNSLINARMVDAMSGETGGRFAARRDELGASLRKVEAEARKMGITLARQTVKKIEDGDEVEPLTLSRLNRVLTDMERRAGMDTPEVSVTITNHPDGTQTITVSGTDEEDVLEKARRFLHDRGH